jgi:hypothetical protein
MALIVRRPTYDTFDLRLVSRELHYTSRQNWNFDAIITKPVKGKGKVHPITCHEGTEGV